MTVYYEVSKCKYIAFVKDLKYVSDRLDLSTTYMLGFEEINDNYNNLNFIEDVKSIDKEHFILVVNAESELFSDVTFEVNQEKVGESSKTGNKTQDVCRDVLLGGSQQLEAFSNSKFTIIPGKRNAGIQSCHPKQNHEVIDSIARNGLMVTPLTSTQFSIGQLFNILATKKSFEIIILHTKLEVSIRDSNYPNDYVEPAYIVGQGEITTVFYRYICLYFFGYTAVSNEDDRDRIYDL